MTSNSIELSTLKAIAHAVIVPTILFIALYAIDKSLVGLSFAYWAIPAFVYIVSNKHKQPGKIFFGIIGTAVALVLIYAILIVT